MNDTNIGKLSKKSNRKSKKVTDLKTKELNENAMETKNVYKFYYVNEIFGSNSTFHLFYPLNPWSDQHLISHYKITPESHTKVMRIKEMIINERNF